MASRKSDRQRHTVLEYYLGGKRQPPILKEEVWTDTQGKVSRYSLAYIDPLFCQKDNGRVLGYDNAHGKHHRHFMGKETLVHFKSFSELLARFEAEVRALRRKHGA